MRSRSGRSTGRSTERARPRDGVDVYLFPAVVGGGLGDIEEVLAAGRLLSSAGFPLYLYREGGRPLPPHVEGPWEWPPVARCRSVRPRSTSALTVSPSWGVSAAPGRPVRFGRGGPWEVECRNVEAAYGAERTLHLSLEEFARTLSSRAETRERLREGGVPARSIRLRARAAEDAHEVDAFRRAFREFRGFSKPNVLHLYATFRPDLPFAREFPEAVQSGPLGTGHELPVRRRTDPRRGAAREWVWYASPASAERIAPEVIAGLSDAAPPVHLFVRSPREWPSVPRSPNVKVVTSPMHARAWKERFARAELRIVTGSRTLIETMELGGPFLYFNGVLGRGAGRRRHRPEKLRAWLELAEHAHVPRPVRADLADFARGRRVEEVVRRAAGRTDGWARFPSTPMSLGFPPERTDAGRVVVAVARALARPEAFAPAIVARWRGSNP